MNHYPVLEHRVIDGDTVKVRLSLPFNLQVEASCRLSGIDCPEAHTPEGHDLKLFLTKFLAGRNLLCSHKKDDKYSGRFVGDILVDGEVHLTRFLLENNLARAYGAGRRKPWQDSDLLIFRESLGRLENEFFGNSQQPAVES